MNQRPTISPRHFRGTGRTTRQMAEAPKGAVFVWCNDNLTYPRKLARKLDRTDLIIIGPGELGDGRMMGRSDPALIIDHAARLDGRQLAAAWSIDFSAKRGWFK